MPDDEKQEKEPDQVVQQTADALFDGLLAFGEGMLRLGETIGTGHGEAAGRWSGSLCRLLPEATGEHRGQKGAAGS